MHPDLELRQVDARKIQDYLLSPTHQISRHKAAFFTSAGFDQDALEKALLAHPLRNPVRASTRTPFGVKHEVQCSIACPDGLDRCIVSVWVVRSDGVARLVTAFPG